MTEPLLCSIESKELSLLFKDAGLPSTVIEKIISHGIAGRHVHMLFELDTGSLARYGLNLGDLFDMKVSLPKVLDALKKPFNEGSEEDESVNNDSKQTCSEGDIGDMSECQASCTASPEKDFSHQQQSSGAISIEEETPFDRYQSAKLPEYATELEISFMSEYEKEVALNCIAKYEYLTSKGLPMKRPSFPCSPSRKNRKSAEGSQSKVREENRSCVPADPEISSPEKKKRKPSKEVLCEKMTIPPDMLTFLKSKDLSKTDKARIQTFLESPAHFRYSVIDILKNTGKDDEDEATSLLGILIDDGVVFGNKLQSLLKILIDWLYSLVGHPNLVTPDMRESLAVSLIASFPKLAQRPVTPGDSPWAWLFDRGCNSGKLARVVARRQSKQKENRPRGGGKGKRKIIKKKTDVAPLKEFLLDNELSKEAKYLRCVSPSDTNRATIEEGMQKTFKERQSLIQNGLYNSNAILMAFPHLKSFEGDMIDAEFERMFPQRGDKLLKNFSDLIPALREVARVDESKFPPETYFKFSDDYLNAITILSKFLPPPKRCYDHEKPQTPKPELEDFIEIVEVGSNVETVITQKRQRMGCPVQPYLVGVGNPKSIQCYIVVIGDGHSIKLPKGCQAVKAIDILFKIHYVLGLHYYLGWKNVYRFLEVHIFNIKPKNNRLSLFMEQFLQLSNVKN